MYKTYVSMGYIVCAVLPAARLSFLALFFFFRFWFLFSGL